ncbi:hypothetical protein IQ273_02390 [Nodosilinea sp. LEGE 07298]|uniref:hypothetical protein n=1 Tax=Nodosilinea sp. LEGE 07298 TaxID=2777970 RepID=UPI00187FE33A|nr:hypothetical protein [Nodosilinea sp. LEGE 07298]MBE9108271.1 hypothetical protein [Nodosilinea sp. LEGE 07298]
MVHQSHGSPVSSDDNAEQLSLFDVEAPGGGESIGGDVVLDSQLEAFVTKVLSEVPKEDQRYFLLRFRFKVLLQELERFSQREREQFTVWLVEAVLETPEEQNETGGRE